MGFRRKTCTHCGDETHPQPQDYNHDTGYGHCYRCLNERGWYVFHERQLTEDVLVKVWEERGRQAAELTSDDSHAKVIEVIVKGEVLYHSTVYSTKEKIFKNLEKKYCGKPSDGCSVVE